MVAVVISQRKWIGSSKTAVIGKLIKYVWHFSLVEIIHQACSEPEVMLYILSAFVPHTLTGEWTPSTSDGSHLKSEVGNW